MRKRLSFFHLGKPDLESDTLATPDWIDYIVCTNAVVDRIILCSSAETPIKALAWTHHWGLPLIRFAGVKTLRRTKRPLMPGWCQQKKSLDKGGGVQEQNDGEGERRKNGGGSLERMGDGTCFFSFLKTLPFVLHRATLQDHYQLVNG